MPPGHTNDGLRATVTDAPRRGMFRNGPHGGLEFLSQPGGSIGKLGGYSGRPLRRHRGFPWPESPGSMTSLIFPSLEVGLVSRAWARLGASQSGEDPRISGWTLSLSPGRVLKSEIPFLGGRRLNKVVTRRNQVWAVPRKYRGTVGWP